MIKRKNHFLDLKAKVALEAVREDMTLAEPSNKCGVHPKMTGHLEAFGDSEHGASV